MINFASPEYRRLYAKTRDWFVPRHSINDEEPPPKLRSGEPKKIREFPHVKKGKAI